MSVKNTVAMTVVAISFGAAAHAGNPNAGADAEYRGIHQNQNETAPIATDLSVESTATQSATIQDLPKKGLASIEGTVESIDSSSEFVLRDATGETIDVQSSTRLSLQAGDRVQVKGLVEAEAMGVGEEINSASVSKLSQ